MMSPNRFAKLTAMCAIGAMFTGGITACSQAPSPTAKKVLMACLAITNIEVGKVFDTQLSAFKLSGENSPVHVCEYNDAVNNTLAILKIAESKSKDPAGYLAKDAAEQKALLKGNIIPIQIHSAEGFGDGAYYLDNTTSPTARSVQLKFIEDGYNIMVQVNNPKDFATGETQAATLAQQALANIKSGKAFQSE